MEDHIQAHSLQSAQNPAPEIHHHGQYCNYNSIPGYSCGLSAVWGLREHIQRSDSLGNGSCMVLCVPTGSVKCGVFFSAPWQVNSKCSWLKAK